MAGSLNKVMLIGRLGRDPELRYTQGGQPVCNLNMATDEGYLKDGQRVEKTEWHRVVVWGKQAETVANYLTKGRLVFVEGKLETRKWQDQQGQDRYSTDIKADRVQFLDSKGGGASDFPAEEGSQAPAPAPAAGAKRPAGKPAGRKPASSDEDMGPAFPSEAGGMDDVPF
jgi:single-strand DNA-binding protein